MLTLKTETGSDNEGVGALSKLKMIPVPPINLLKKRATTTLKYSTLTDTQRGKTFRTSVGTRERDDGLPTFSSRFRNPGSIKFYLNNLPKINDGK